MLIFLDGTPGFEWKLISDLCHAPGSRQPPALPCPTEKEEPPVYFVLPRTDDLSWGRPSLNESRIIWEPNCVSGMLLGPADPWGTIA